MTVPNWFGFLTAAATFLGSANVLAAPVTIAISGTVSTVNDHGSLLGSAIQVGDLISGTYTFESATADSSAVNYVGDYWHTTSPYGISLSINGLRFRTDPNDVSFVVQVVQNHPSYTMHNYLLRSYNNLFDVSAPPSPFSGLNHISWQLDDTSGTALADDSLPGGAPILSHWENRRLTINSGSFGPGGGFFVAADITSATAVAAVPEPETYALMLAGLGLLGVVSRRRRQKSAA